MILDTQPYDYVIVGAGSAGCVIASRLTEDPDTRVLLIEAGRAPTWSDFRIHIPAAKGQILNDPAYDWMYDTAPQSELAGRTIRWHQGKIAGGSSSINGMVWVRGHPDDFDGWAERDPSLTGWRHASLLPYFERSESLHGHLGQPRRSSGPMDVQKAQGASPLSKVFVSAGHAAGFGPDLGVNGSQCDGIGLLDMSVHHGRRVTTWSAYLKPVERRPNLSILTQAQAVELLFDGSRCTGVSYKKHGKLHVAKSRGEVILCLGAIGTPTLLLRSGIGPADDLRELGIDVQSDVPGVGANLHDHLQIAVVQECTKPVTIQPLMKRHRQYLTGLRWLFTRTGLGATNHFEAGGFVRSDHNSDRPDIQFLFSPHSYNRFSADTRAGSHGYQVHAGPLQPKSRGRLRLRSARLDDDPVIDPRYLSDPSDLILTRKALRMARDVLSQAPFDSYRGREIYPGKDVQSDAEIDDFIRHTANSGYHVCGTCKMGSGEEAVVDSSLKVRGVEGLRIADSSVIPTITSGNINAPTIMIGEKASDLLKNA